MADMYAVKKETLDNIANAIRTKRDITDGISVDDMAMQIGLISGGGNVMQGEFIADGTTPIIDVGTTEFNCFLILNVPFLPETPTPPRTFKIGFKNFNDDAQFVYILRSSGATTEAFQVQNNDCDIIKNGTKITFTSGAISIYGTFTNGRIYKWFAWD